MQTKQLEGKASGSELYENALHKFQTIRDEDQDVVIGKQILYYRNLVSKYNSHLLSLPFRQYPNNKVFRLFDLVKEFEGKYTDLSKSLSDSFMLFIVGMGNYGKSTLINALLEQPAAETDVLPKTWKIDVFRNDLEQGKAVLRFKDQTETLITHEEAKLFVAQEEKKREESELEISRILKKEKGNLKSQVAYNEFQTKLRREKLYESNLIEVRWGVKNNYRLNDFHIVDTPGLTQKVMGEIQHSIHTYYHKADGIIWLLDAQVISARGTKDLVEDLKKSLNTVGGKQSDNTIAILNRMDLVYKNKGQEGVDSVMKDANNIFKNYFKAIIPFSAKQAFEGIMSDDLEQIESSGIQGLYSQVHSQFRLHAKRIQCQKKMESCKSYGYQVNDALGEFLVALEGDYSKLKDEHGKFLEVIGRKKTELNNRISSLITSYQKKVKEHISYKTDRLFDISSLEGKKAFVNDTIFKSDAISIQVKKLQEEVAKECAELYQFYQKKLFFTEYPNLHQNNLPLAIKKQLGINVDLQSHQFNTDNFAIGSGIAGAAIAALFLGPIGLLIGGIASFFGGGFFGKQSKINDLKGELNSTLTSTTKDIKGKLRNMVYTQLQKVEQDITFEAIQSLNTVYGMTGNDASLEELNAKIEALLTTSKQFSKDITGDAPDMRPSLKELLLLSK